MKAVRVDQPFSDEGWLFERKLDGVRCAAFREAGTVRLVSRSGRDVSGSYPELVEGLGYSGPQVVADGEVVAFAGGVTSFARLQQRTQIHDPQRARRSPVAVLLYLFDLLHLDGHDITALPLRARKRLLRTAITFGGRVRFTPHRNAEGQEADRRACAAAGRA